MQLLNFECEGFRCLTEVRFTPGPGVNIIHGRNAQGKTSLLEAILFAATSKSHRTGNEPDLLRHGAEHFRLRATAQRHDRQVVVEALWRQGVKRYKVNGVGQTRISDILGKIAVVLFSPEDLALVKGSGSVRRRFLDMELSQISPAYLNALQRYRQALRQRNELLKVAQPDSDQLDAWDQQLAEHGSLLMRERAQFLRTLNSAAAAAYGRLAGAEAMTLAYQPDLPDEDGYMAQLAKSRQADVRRQMTHRGPHRDDIDIVIAGRAGRSFASQGQQKTAALAVKLAELDLVRERTGEYPVLMMDEVLSELDQNRAHSLMSAVPTDVQWIVTTADADRAPFFSSMQCSKFHIEQGRLNEE
jgi:DNA replication and repair protein RecF